MSARRAADHWTNRAAIMTLATGAAVFFSGFDIAEMHEELGHQITQSGLWLFALGMAAWLVTLATLKGSTNE